jgi:hypothetical protein
MTRGAQLKDRHEAGSAAAIRMSVNTGEAESCVDKRGEKQTEQKSPVVPLIPL